MNLSEVHIRKCLAGGPSTIRTGEGIKMHKNTNCIGRKKFILDPWGDHLASAFESLAITCQYNGKHVTAWFILSRTAIP